MFGQVPGWGNKNNEISVAGWVEYSQNATLIFISAYSSYVFCGKIRTSHASRSRTLLLRNNNTAVDTIVSTAVSVLVAEVKLERPFRKYSRDLSQGIALLCSLLIFVNRLKKTVHRTVFGRGSPTPSGITRRCEVRPLKRKPRSADKTKRHPFRMPFHFGKRCLKRCHSNYALFS